MRDEKTIGPQLLEFRKSGGSIASLKERIGSQLQLSEKQLQGIASQHLDVFMSGIPQQLEEMLAEWLKNVGLHYIPQHSRTAHGAGFSGVSVDAPDVFEEMTGLLDLISYGVIGYIVGSIVCGTALSGPLGWIIGALIAVIAGVVAVGVGKEVAREKVESVDLPVRLVKLALSEKKVRRLLEEGRETLGETITNEVWEVVEQPMQALLEKIEEKVEKEIGSLSAIDQL